MTACLEIEPPNLTDFESTADQPTEPGYDAWLREKVGATLKRVESGEAEFIEHQDVLPLLAARMAARLADNGR